MKKLLPTYILYLLVMNVVFISLTATAHFNVEALDVARVTMNDGLLYMIIIYLPLASSGMKMLKVLLWSVPIIMVLVGLKLTFALAIYGPEIDIVDNEGTKVWIEHGLSILIHVISAAVGYEAARIHDPDFKFFMEKSKPKDGQLKN
ncbi:hypothetical protein OH460_08450 [Vibrio sp. Makdt]|uniref:hypothetical protein n=1 Tax=Vibrio sp. Makdt TaxID=2998828 RepID=UPI0022CD3CEE|nr:hypothetical protein [Vibrio sp. Makdt]MDA0152330.1 hypothetical protein [Vibrio sp. Makdt]